LTYRGALAVLGRQDHPLLEKLDKLLGGAILAGTAIWGPAVWAFIEPKSELIGVTGTLLDKAKQWTLGTSGFERRELLAAAHTVLTLSAFFEGVSDVLGPHFTSAGLTDRERLRIAGASVDEPNFVQRLLSAEIPMPTASDKLDGNFVGFFGIAADTVKFAAGLAIADDFLRGTDWPELTQEIIDHASSRYRDAYLRFAVDVPEFALWISWNSDAATRDAIQGLRTDVVATLAEQSHSLRKLHDLLSFTAIQNRPAVRSHRELLTMAAKAVLTKPLLRSAAQNESSVSFPTAEQGFVTPHFRLAAYNEKSQPSVEAWWDQIPVAGDLDTFLAAQLVTADSAHLPLLILGHPGAGKSLLTEILAARLPDDAFTVVRVPLRDVDPTKAIHEQISQAIKAVLKRDVSWGDLADECADTTRVVILDGFDELVLATGVTQSAYLEQVASFQESELDLGRPVAVIVTSRTLVADRARIPLDTWMIKLEEFDDDQIATWLGSWNAANARTERFRELDVAEVTAQRELACQPLLLLILAIYAAESGQRLDSEHLSGASLYRRLLNSFIRRQVEEKSPQPLGAAEVESRMAIRRTQLSLAAFGMFNRGLQHITNADLDADLKAFQPSATARARSSFDHQLTDAESAISSFFFIEDSHIKDGRQTYEFLHATFAEYLIAESTMDLLGRLSDQYGLSSTGGFLDRVEIQDDRLAALLSHQVFVKRTPVINFAIELFASFEAARQRNVLNLLVELLRLARTSRRQQQYERYEPTPYDTINRLACYTANLATLRIMLTNDTVSPDELAPDDCESLSWWRSMVNLWESGLGFEGWHGILDDFTLSYDEPPQIVASDGGQPGDRERLLGRTGGELAIAVGERFVDSAEPVESDAEKELNLLAVEIMDSTTGTWPLARLLPVDEAKFVEVANAMAAGNQLNPSVEIAFWQFLARTARDLSFGVASELATQLLTSRRGLWLGLGCELAAVVAAHPRLLLGDGAVAELCFGTSFPGVHIDAQVAVALLWRAEQTAGQAEATALRRLRSKFEVLVAEEDIMDAWFAPEFLTYLRDERPSYWRDHDGLLNLLFRQTALFLSQIAPMDALYLAQRVTPADDRDDRLSIFMRNYLAAQAQPIDGLHDAELMERLTAYAEVPWERP
jgi:hypothetical protein